MKNWFMLPSLLLLTINTIAQSGDSVYVFSYFKKNGQDGLHLAYSKDGYKWEALKDDSSFLTPTAGVDKLMRDPCIIRGADGVCHMVWTVSWHENAIGYASSPDLIHWGRQQTVPVMAHEPTARNCWAPEIVYDSRKKEYMIYWATTIPGRFPISDSSGDNNHRIYYTTTKDFATYTKAKVLYNQDFNVIDATIVREEKQYIMFLKDETLRPSPQKNLRVAVSKTLTGGYGKPSPAITGNYWAEGPTAIKIGTSWVVYFDKYREGKYGAVASSNLKDWQDISDKISMPKGLRHGTVFKVSAQEFAKLLD